MERSAIQWGIHLLLIVAIAAGSQLFVADALAQSQEEIGISGSVVETGGTPLPGVNVVVKGTVTGTITDVDGNYELTAPGDAVLIFSFVGFEAQEIPVEGRSQINVTLAPDVEALEEVVVVGYGALRKKDVTGSVSSINERTLKEIPAASIETAMQGRAPGVVVTSTSAEPGGGLSVRIRGGNSVSGNNEPLFVIDGFPMYNDNNGMASEFERYQSTNLLANLNPNDIESMEILKDASATAIYGSRGANGVVLITTKQGRAGRPKIDFEHYTSTSTARTIIPLADAFQYATVYNQALTARGDDPRYDGTNGDPDPETGKVTYFPTPAEIQAEVGDGTNWQRELLRTGIAQNYQLGISGGTPRLTYNLSGNYYDNEGVLKNSAYTRYSLRANLFSQLNDRLSFRLNTTGSRTVANRANTSNTRTVGGGGGRAGVIWQAFRANPIARPDEFFFEDEMLGTQQASGFNPVMDLENTHVLGYTSFMLANATIEFEILDGLKFTSKGGANITNNDKEWFWNQNTALGYRFNGQAREALANSIDYVNENYFTYKKDFSGNHAVNLTAGTSWQQTQNRQTILEAQDYTVNFENGLNKYEFAQMHSRHNTGRVKHTLLSYYGRAFYSLMDRYLFTVTVRGDGSSKFAQNNKWAVFPSAAVAWRFSDEPLLANADWLSNGKLRLSYGRTGSQAISPYGSLARMRVDAFTWADGGLATGVVPASPGNPDLKWETTEQLNAGLDLGFADDRITFTSDVYRKTTRDLLQQLAVPGQSGFSSIVSNFGSIRNSGVELGLSIDVLDGPLKWTTNANYSRNVSEVLDLGELDHIQARGFFPTPLGSAHIVTKGEPLGNFHGWRVVGLLSEEDIAAGYPTLGSYNLPGLFKFWNNPDDEDGINSINADDKVVLGNALPDFTFGWSNNLSYKDFGLSFFVQGVIGHDILNMHKMISEYGIPSFGVPTSDYMNDYWSEDNPDAYYPRPAEFAREGAVITDRLVEDGSFVRLKNVTLSYNVPPILRGIQTSQVYVTATNLLTLTGYSGYDPEVSSLGQTNLEPGVDIGSYPRSRTFTLGVKLGF